MALLSRSLEAEKVPPIGLPFRSELLKAIIRNPTSKSGALIAYIDLIHLIKFLRPLNWSFSEVEYSLMSMDLPCWTAACSTLIHYNTPLVFYQMNKLKDLPLVGKR